MNLARTKALFPLTLAVLAACGSGNAGSTPPTEASTSDGAAPAPTLATFAVEAIDDDAVVRDRAIAALRQAGPDGLAALLGAHAEAVERLRTLPLTADRAALDDLREDPAMRRLRDAIDRVAAQRDALASGLYWYTDLAEAQIAAARSGRPILSLRMLGRLDEEASCANSRFFRWLLYPSPAVRAALAGFVLHWSSERPAPHVTIDMGDGRTIERTITGNSVHFVLDASGHVVDAITGLHTPGEFVTRLTEARAIASECGVRVADRACLAAAHGRALDATRAAWSAIATDAGGRLPDWDGLARLDAPVTAAPSAAIAMPITMGKMSIELPMLRMIGAAPPTPPPAPIAWDVVASFLPPASFDEVITGPSQALARLKTGDVDDAAMLRATYDRVVRDGLLNRFGLERRFHAWLADPGVPNDFASIDTRVYAELFLTPASDPWLGLRSESDWDVMEVTGSTGTEN